jgi:hypothetical protein
MDRIEQAQSYVRHMLSTNATVSREHELQNVLAIINAFAEVEQRIANLQSFLPFDNDDSFYDRVEDVVDYDFQKGLLRRLQAIHSAMEAPSEQTL